MHYYYYTWTGTGAREKFSMSEPKKLEMSRTTDSFSVLERESNM